MYGYDNKLRSGSLVEKMTGRGLQLSPMVVGGRHITNTGIDRISQSLYCLFHTRRGERLFQPEYGTRVFEQLFEPNDFILCDMVKYYAEEDIKLWEPRIEARAEVSVEEGSNVVHLKIIYSIKGDGTVYAFTVSLSRTTNQTRGDAFE